MPCHTPHSGSLTLGAPLWNHDVTAATFTPYTSPTLNATVPEPSDSSKACLSCHDGTVAVDSFGGQVGTVFLEDEQNLGIDLSNDHPISFVYDSGLAALNGELNDPGGLDPAVRLDADGMMQCTTCHDPHDDSRYIEGRVPRFWVAGSVTEVCISCHELR